MTPQKYIKEVLRAHTKRLMAIPGVTGVGLGRLSDNSECIQIFVTVKDKEIINILPTEFDGFPVVVLESGEFKPL